MKFFKTVLFIIIVFNTFSYCQISSSDIDVTEQNLSEADKYFLKGLDQYYTQDFERALLNFNAAVRKNSNHPQFRFYLGKTFYKLGKLSRAIKEFETALMLKKDYDEVRKFLAESYFTLSKWKKALEQYKKLVEKDPDSFDAHFKLGQIYFVPSINNLKESLFHLQKALELSESNAYVHYFIGRVFLQQKKFLDSISKFDKAIELEPSNGLFYYWRGNAYYGQMDFFSSKTENWKSAEDFRKAMELGFDQPKTFFMFANTNLHRGLYLMENNRATDGIELLKRAINYYRKVIIIQPDASNAFNNLGLAYMGINKLQEAVSAFLKAIELEPTVTFFHNNLGDAYYRLGNFKKAIEQWELCLELEPNLEDIKSAIFGDKRSIPEKIRDAKLRW